MDILLIDDETSLLRTLRTTLESMGHTVGEAASGEEARQALERLPFDVAFLDLRLGREVDHLSAEGSSAISRAALARFGHLDLSAQSEWLSAQRSDTPTHLAFSSGMATPRVETRAERRHPGPA
jgi:CheY-like chemotaxis protein